jgi:hypothetical protein
MSRWRTDRRRAVAIATLPARHAILDVIGCFEEVSFCVGRHDFHTGAQSTPSLRSCDVAEVDTASPLSAAVPPAWSSPPN